MPSSSSLSSSSSSISAFSSPGLSATSSSSLNVSSSSSAGALFSSSGDSISGSSGSTSAPLVMTDVKIARSRISPFSYEGLTKGLKDRTRCLSNSDDSFMAAYDRTKGGEPTNFYVLACLKPPKSRAAKKEERIRPRRNRRQRKHHGWKFHISLDDKKSGNIALAWDILADKLVAHKIGTAKVAIPTHKVLVKTPSKGAQPGKQIVIYTYFNNDEQRFEPPFWERFFRELTQAYVEAGVMPGYDCSCSGTEPEYNIRGSSYFYYRYDGKPQPGANPFSWIDYSRIPQPASLGRLQLSGEQGEKAAASEIPETGKEQEKTPHL